MIRNPLVKRIVIFLLCIIGAGTIIFFAYSIINKDYNNQYYDLGEKSSSTDYTDVILKSYTEYEQFVSKYNIKKVLNEESFTSNYYLASFQDYDKCAESKPKTLNSIIYNENKMTVVFDTYNKCGWCKSHMMLYFLKLEVKDYTDVEIDYDYKVDKQLNCDVS